MLINLLENQLKIILRRIPSVAILIGSIALLFYVALKIPIPQNQEASITENTVALQIQEESIVGLPVRLRIPSINVDAPFEYVGLTADKAMDVPRERSNVAWFKLGQRPGENGTAVIAGHYGRQDTKGSVFDNLHKLRKGDKIYIEDDRGDIISFVVRESRRYDPQADASAVFGSDDGKSHLNLITCEGIWDEASDAYSRRLVVFTDRE